MKEIIGAFGPFDIMIMDYKEKNDLLPKDKNGNSINYQNRSINIRDMSNLVESRDLDLSMVKEEQYSKLSLKSRSNIRIKKNPKLKKAGPTKQELYNKLREKGVVDDKL